MKYLTLCLEDKVYEIRKNMLKIIGFFSSKVPRDEIVVNFLPILTAFKSNKNYLFRYNYVEGFKEVSPFFDE